MSVYVVQERKKFDRVTGELVAAVNIMPAAEYGDLIEVFDSKQHALLTSQVVTKLRTKLRKFGDDDYLLPIGNPILIGVATAMAAKNNMGRVKLLHWDRELMRYIVLNYEL